MPIKIDKIDRAILEQLQRDASLSTADLATQVGLSMSPCWRRIRRLEKAGVISRRVAILDRERLGLEVTVFASVKLSAHGRQSLPEFEAAIEEHDEVVACYVMTGEVDYLLQVVTRDIRSYENFLRNHLLQLPTVREVHSQIVLSQLKHTTELPLFDLGSS
ncbi:MAG: Lrp/AsnC family transcriptional regulator [Myxococcales bacterium]|nr:Lrp/AsnC family transcriptional regulator [Myxococcales bacterium]MCH7866905.1 Lrp/AsnC family transcriptional regulator [Myxococcales bacterium]